MRPRFMRMVLCASAAALVASAVAVAATMGVTSQRLTAWRVASTVPITTCTLTASEDSYVAEDDNSNFGSATTLHVRSYQTTVVIITTQRNRRSFVKFDLSPCAIPTNAEVKTATMSVFLSSAPNQSRTWNVRRVTGAWTEGGITWSNQPATTATTSVTTGTTSSVTLQATVTSDVASFVSGAQTNNGWRFSDSAESSNTERLGQLAASEATTASQRPTLVINYYP